MNSLLSQKDTIPIPLREMFYTINVISEKKYKGAGVQSVGALLFLRLLCPSLVTPVEFGICKDRPKKNAIRTLILITKILQNVANRVYDNQKEEYMKHVREFTQNLGPKTEEFLLEISKEPAGYSENNESKSIDLILALDSISQFIISAKEKSLKTNDEKAKKFYLEILATCENILKEKEQNHNRLKTSKGSGASFFSKLMGIGEKRDSLILKDHSSPKNEKKEEKKEDKKKEEIKENVQENILKEEISKLKENNKKQIIEIATLKENMGIQKDDYEKQIAHINLEVTNLKEKETNLRNELNENKSSQEKKESELISQNQKNEESILVLEKKLKDQQEHYEKVIKQKEEDYKNKENEVLNQMKEQSTHYDKQIEEHLSSITKLKLNLRETEQLKEKLSLNELGEKEFTKKINEFTLEKNKILNEKENLNLQFTELQRKFDLLSEELKRKEKRFENERKVLNEENSELKTKVSQLKEELLKKEEQEKDRDLNRLQIKKEMKKIKEDSDKTISELTDKLRKKNEEFEHLKIEVEEKSKLVTELQSKNKKLSTEKLELEEREKELKEKLEKLEELEKGTEDDKLAKEKYKNLKAEYLYLLEDYELMEGKLEQSKQQKNQLKNKLSEEREALNEKLDEELRNVRRLERELKKSQQSEIILQNKLQFYENKIRDLEEKKKNNDSDETIKKLEARVIKLKETQKKLQDELDLMDKREEELIKKYKKREEKLLSEIESLKK